MKNTSVITLLLACAALPASATSIPAGVLRDSLPENWELDQQYFQTTPSDDKWWESFNDPILKALINRAVENNFNVLAAQQRIEAARQVSRATKGGYYPTYNRPR